jgi:hypothetical protein
MGYTSKNGNPNGGNDDKSVDVMGYFTLVSVKLIWKKGFKAINFIKSP